MRCTYNYLIELRIADYNKKIIRSNNNYLRENYGIYNLERVPHMTLYGGFKQKRHESETNIRSVLNGIVRKYNNINYRIEGYDRKINYRGKEVLAYKIQPSNELLSLHNQILKKMSRISISKSPWDEPEMDQWYHITIANPIDKQRIDNICGTKGILGIFAKKWAKSFKLNLNAQRLTVLKNSKILYEYDFKSKKWMNRTEALK